MKTMEQLYKAYATKIYGFAYKKTGNTHQAEDLSSEILINLCSKDWQQMDIDYMNSYIYKICEYTWSKHLRKNKREWDCLTNMSFDQLHGDETPESDIIRMESYQHLKQEIVYLSKTRRELLIGYYYEDLSGKELAKAYNLKDATVRWHLFEAKKELKERMENHTNTIYKPIKLWVGHYGWHNNDTMRTLETDVLLQNVCYICYKKPLSIEEIARTLGVAAVYIEDKIGDMVKMSYMTETRGRFKTNFMIQDPTYLDAAFRFRFEHSAPFANALYEALINRLDRIRDIGFIGSEMPDNELVWHLLFYTSMSVIGKIDTKIIKDNHLEHGAPMRPDGSKHWVHAGFTYDNRYINEDDAYHEYLTAGTHFGIKTRGDEHFASMQMDLQLFGLDHVRNFSTEDLKGLIRVKEIIDQNQSPNTYDKEIIAKLIAGGYVANDSGELSICVPYLNKDQKEQLDKYIDEIGEDLMSYQSLFLEYTKFIDQYIPKHLDKNERNHYKTSFSPHATLLYLLHKEGQLKTPTENEIKRICTLVWEQ